MIYLIISIFIFISALFYGYFIKKKCKVYDNSIEEQLKQIKNEYENEKKNLDNLILQENSTRERIAKLSKDAETAYDTQKKLSLEAFSNWSKALDNEYKDTELEYQKLTNILQNAYGNKQAELKAETAEVAKDLDKIRSTRNAAIEAARREKEISANTSFYCIEISDEDKADIIRLENVKKTLNKPRILSMLIWSTYYQKPLKQLAANILGPNIVTGIYKITNTITGEVYVGQATDVASRWSQHCKAGLGIDTPAGNKLYKAMMEYGVYSFSWELLEKCETSELNEKERFYIDLYQSVNYGYNILKGVN